VFVDGFGWNKDQNERESVYLTTVAKFRVREVSLEEKNTVTSSPTTRMAASSSKHENEDLCTRLSDLFPPYRKPYHKFRLVLFNNFTLPRLTLP